MGLAALIAGGEACHADALESRLIGAWAASAADCARLFEPRGGAPAFRQPVDKFAQAAIIAPQQIVTPSNTCRVQKVSHQGGAIKVTANCNDTIGYSTDTAEIRFGSGGEIIYSATGDPSLAHHADQVPALGPEKDSDVGVRSRHRTGSAFRWTVTRNARLRERPFRRASCSL
jgi:hypothetical protein